MGLSWVVGNGESLCDLSKVLLVCRQIWKERNLVVFQNKIPNPTWIVKSDPNIGREFIDANGIIPVVYNGSRSSPPFSIRWSPSNAGFVKLNFDGSVVNQGATVGFVIRNEKGEPIVAGARFIGQNTISTTECLALRDGLWMAKAKGLAHIMVEGDSKLVIESICRAYCPPWRLKVILEDIC
ncbi:uncharacterized protein LOC126630282 [Malus sylvestris]|uniref:uncharacterized protein LOC126630282 n=1 Tax=Malus sylvestris TaxID=3752 RepID=UPI0021ABB4F1|nr:uncharacterized protein LOC126630282 [Malus sylvestris]